MADLGSYIPGTVYSRSDVGMPSQPGGAYRDLSSVDTWVTHWTTGDALGVSDTAQWVKNIYDYHTGNRGWRDIGYNFLVDRFGNVFFGRGRYRVGAHAPGANTNGIGVAYLGGHDRDISPKGKLAMLGLYEWLNDEGGITIYGPERYGHRDFRDTTCPGDKLYEWTRSGMPRPETDEEPENRQPDDEGKPDYIVAVVADNDIDEGMARVLGKVYQWRFLGIPNDDRGYQPPSSDRVTDYRIGTAVRVGAARNVDDGPWDEVHDVGGRDRDETAKAVEQRIAADEGDSRSVV